MNLSRRMSIFTASVLMFAAVTVAAATALSAYVVTRPAEVPPLPHLTKCPADMSTWTTEDIHKISCGSIGG